MIIQPDSEERAILVGVRTENEPPWEMEESLAELFELTRSAGGHPLKSVTQTRTSPDSAYFLGRGKANMLVSDVADMQADIVIFDCELTPAQQRNLEDLLKCKVIDRTQLILDIFARRAHTREGKIQVELAQLEYLLPRLTGHGITMSRVGGGIGARWGPGETKLEVDRRRIRDRIGRLRKDLDQIRLHREVQRKRRIGRTVVTAALVGYTNAGKSSLLNAITDASAFVEGKLFATLDPLSRKAKLPNDQIVVFTDTVGLIRKLPHSLIAAFRATLEEATYADVLLLVVDSSHRDFHDHIRVAKQVLGELKALDRPIITVFNKIDLLPDPSVAQKLTSQVAGSVAVSAKTRQNIRGLLEAISTILAERRMTVKLRIPQVRGDVVAMTYEKGHVLEQKFENAAILLTAEIDASLIAKFRDFIVDSE